MAMARKKTHLDDSQIEAYCSGTVPEPELAELEEHLLVCESCQQRISEADAYVRSMRNAASRVRAKEQKPRKAWAASGLVPVLGFALAVGSVGMYLHSRQPGLAPRVAVALQVTRGGVLSQAPAGKPLLLQPGIEGLPAAAKYRLELVDGNGKPILQQELQPGTGVEAPAQAAGVYYVRLYTLQGALLREFALQVQGSR